MAAPHDRLTLHHINNNPAKVLGIRQQVLDDISQAELTQNWDAVIEKYGTHYVSEVRVGGLMEAVDVDDAGCASVCRKKSNAKPTASMLSSIDYLSGITDAHNFEDNFVAPQATVYSVGGDPDLGVGCVVLDACTPYNMRAWQSKVFAQSAAYAVVLTPISLLFSNGIGRLNRCLSIDTALGKAANRRMLSAVSQTQNGSTYGQALQGRAVQTAPPTSCVCAPAATLQLQHALVLLLAVAVSLSA